MRRLVAATVVLVLALSLAGCGGGGSAATTPPTAATPAAAPTVVGGSATTVLPAIPNKSANDTDTFVAFPNSSIVPADLKQKIVVEKQPTIVYFYDSTQQSSTEVRTIIDTVRAENRGLVDLVAYDIGKYMSVDANGVESVDPKLSDDPAASAAVKLARDPAIDVSYTPFLLVTDGQGYIIYKHAGLVDRAFLEREVFRAAR